MERRRARRDEYPHHEPVPTRWADNDAYGHVNNVVYYAYFDTAVALWLLRHRAIGHAGSPVIGLVVETGCRFRAPLAFPDRVTAGLRVARLGRTSVRYEIGVFREAEEEASAEGHFVHAYVDLATRRVPTPLPAVLREALAPLRTTATEKAAI